MNRANEEPLRSETRNKKSLKTLRLNKRLFGKLPDECQACLEPFDKNQTRIKLCLGRLLFAMISNKSACIVLIVGQKPKR